MHDIYRTFSGAKSRFGAYLTAAFLHEAMLLYVLIAEQ